MLKCRKWKFMWFYVFSDKPRLPLYFFNFFTQILSVYWELTVCISCFFFHPWAIHTFLKLTCIIYSTWFKFFTCIICICFWMCVYVEQFILWTSFHFKSSFWIAILAIALPKILLFHCMNIYINFKPLPCNMLHCYILVCVCVCIYIYIYTHTFKKYTRNYF